MAITHAEKTAGPQATDEPAQLTEQAAGGPGHAAVMRLFGDQGHAAGPGEVAKILSAFPQEREQVLSRVNELRGNAFVAAVVGQVAVEPPAKEPVADARPAAKEADPVARSEALFESPLTSTSPGSLEAPATVSTGDATANLLGPPRPFPPALLAEVPALGQLRRGHAAELEGPDIMDELAGDYVAAETKRLALDQARKDVFDLKGSWREVGVITAAALRESTSLGAVAGDQGRARASATAVAAQRTRVRAGRRNVAAVLRDQELSWTRLQTAHKKLGAFQAHWLAFQTANDLEEEEERQKRDLLLKLGGAVGSLLTGGPGELFKLGVMAWLERKAFPPSKQEGFRDTLTAEGSEDLGFAIGDMVGGMAFSRLREKVPELNGQTSKIQELKDALKARRRDALARDAEVASEEYANAHHAWMLDVMKVGEQGAMLEEEERLLRVTTATMMHDVDEKTGGSTFGDVQAAFAALDRWSAAIEASFAATVTLRDTSVAAAAAIGGAAPGDLDNPAAQAGKPTLRAAGRLGLVGDGVVLARQIWALERRQEELLDVAGLPQQRVIMNGNRMAAQARLDSAIRATAAGLDPVGPVIAPSP